MQSLKLYAGARAYKKIQQNGLSASDVSAVFGASGAAKWLTIYGLDKAIFGQWLTTSEQPIDLYGTSIGAFKLAAAAQHNPDEALSKLASAYINQWYEGQVTASQIAVATDQILQAFLSAQAVSEILDNDRYHFHCGSVRCLGILASEQLAVQKLAMLKAFLLSWLGKGFHSKTFERVIFHSQSNTGHLSYDDGFTQYTVPLTATNFHSAILSSGSIPVVMPGVKNIEGTVEGVYRDGGLLDYHPVPSNVFVGGKGVVLYPHFYSDLKEGWFDKFSPWRRVAAERLSDTLLIAPSAEFVASLPGGAIPDRKDFLRLKDNNQERIRRWNIARERSLELGEEFLQLVKSGDIAAKVQLFKA